MKEKKSLANPPPQKKKRGTGVERKRWRRWRWMDRQMMQEGQQPSDRGVTGRLVKGTRFASEG